MSDKELEDAIAESEIKRYRLQMWMTAYQNPYLYLENTKEGRRQAELLRKTAGRQYPIPSPKEPYKDPE